MLAMVKSAQAARVQVEEAREAERVAVRELKASTERREHAEKVYRAADRDLWALLYEHKSADAMIAAQADEQGRAEADKADRFLARENAGDAVGSSRTAAIAQARQRDLA